jgi:hypothetical protein
MAATISSLTKKILEEHYKSGTVRNQICQVIDVFTKKVYTAPSSSIRKMREIAAACEEIKFWWSHLTQKAQE